MNTKAILSKIIPKGVKKRINKQIEKKGYQIFLETGKTPEESYKSMIKLYCATDGISNEEFNKKIIKDNPPLTVPEDIEGIIGKYSANDFKKVNKELNQKGYTHFEQKLSREICEKLYNFALKAPSKIPPTYKEKIIYNPENPLAEIYRFDMIDLMNNEDIQKLIIDPVLLNIARNYLGCEPIFDFPAMWWSTSFQKEASSEAAQLYHFDMDRIKWLKIFFYINDVTLENGPHCYIQGTHLPNTKPNEILKRGYERIQDSELHPYYKPDDIKIVCGQAGSIFAGDTKCWHKGTNLKKGHRLVLEFEYTSSLFGINIPKLESDNYSKEFKDFCVSNAKFASNIVLKS
jgi:hypothetical protein